MCAWLRSNQSLIQKGNHYLALPGLPLRLNFPGASFSSLCVSLSAGPLGLGWERVRRVCRRRLAPRAAVGCTPPRSEAQPDLRGRAVAEQGAVPGFPQPSPFCCGCFWFCLTTLCPCALQNGKIRTFFCFWGAKHDLQPPVFTVGVQELSAAAEASARSSFGRGCRCRGRYL